MPTELQRILTTTRPGASRSALLVAIGVSLILVSFILIFSTRSGPSKREAIDDFNPDDVPDLLGAPGEDVARIDGQPQFGDTTNARVRLKDRSDPTRMAWDIEFARLSPVKDSDLVEIDRPRAWYLLGNNNLVFIRSDKAEFLMPDITSEPVSGRFTGNVEVLQFERMSDGSLPAPIAGDSSVRITTNWLDFDAVASELSTTETVLIASDSIDADCSGLRVVFNEVDERVELLEIPGSLVATIRPGMSESGGQPEPSSEPQTETKPAQANAGGNARPKPPAAPAEPEGPETFYAVTFEGSVHVEQPSRRIDADRARVWIRLVNNEIPSNDFASVPMPTRVSDPLGMHAALVSMVIASRQPEIPSDRDLKLGDDVLFRCVGPTVVRPMDERPAALGSGDDVALRFESNPGGKVTFSDSVLLASGESSAIEYGFTNKILALTGYDGQPTMLDVQDTGSIMGESLTIGLATGIGQAMGAGVLTEAESGRSLTWNEQADVVFRTEEGWITGSIEQAIASGTVVMRDEDAEVFADSINTRFAAGDDTLIERAVLTGGVRARTASGSLDADRLDVRFDTSSGRSEPVTVTASGQVRGEQDEAVITAGLLEADLAPDADGKPRVTVARASETVRFIRADGAFAEGDSLRAELDTEHALVEGAPARVGANSATVAARSITLNGSARSIVVPGAGEFTLMDDEGVLTIATAEWTGSMSYTDETGMLEAVGDVVAVSTSSALSRDTLAGDRLFALVQPSDGSSVLDERADRQLISAEITGDEAREASVESLRFAQVGDEEPVQVMALLGNRIELDNIGGIVRVPTPGKLVVSDRQVDPESTDSSTMRGSALFDWEGDLLLDRPAGEVTMSNRVRMVHRPQGDGAVAELECESLKAAFSEDSPTGDLTSGSGESQLRNVLASGAVWARSGDQQMIADALNYEAKTQAARATAQNGGWVTLFDPTQPAPVTAAELIWSLRSGRIEVVRPNPVSIPR